MSHIYLLYFAIPSYSAGVSKIFGLLFSAALSLSNDKYLNKVSHVCLRESVIICDKASTRINCLNFVDIAWRSLFILDWQTSVLLISKRGIAYYSSFSPLSWYTAICLKYDDLRQHEIDSFFLWSCLSLAIYCGYKPTRVHSSSVKSTCRTDLITDHVNSSRSIWLSLGTPKVLSKT